MSSGTLAPTNATAPTSGVEPRPHDAQALGDLEPYARKLRSLEQKGSLTLARILNSVEQNSAAALPATTP
jgi:hypothetical protein